MDIVGFIQSLNLFDLLVMLFLVGMFVLGFAQGTIRRVVGTLTITFSFFLAAWLSRAVRGVPRLELDHLPGRVLGDARLPDPVHGRRGGVLPRRPGDVLQAQIFARHPVIDEVLGGFLGVAQGLLFLMLLSIMLDQYFLYAPNAPAVDEVPFLRPFWEALNASGFGSLLHETVIPNFVNLFSPLLPDYIKATYSI